MQDYVVLISLDEYCQESKVIKKNNTYIEAFDYMGKLWPLNIGKRYLVNFELQQLDKINSELIQKTDGKLVQVNKTYEY